MGFPELRLAQGQRFGEHGFGLRERAPSSQQSPVGRQNGGGLAFGSAGSSADREAVAEKRLGGFEVAALHQYDAQIGLVGGDIGMGRAELPKS